jgi:hypothetical protein
LGIISLVIFFTFHARLFPRDDVQKIECAIALCVLLKISCFLSECTLVSPGNVFVAPDGRFGDWLLYIGARANHLVADEIHDWQRFATPPSESPQHQSFA